LNIIITEQEFIKKCTEVFFKARGQAEMFFQYLQRNGGGCGGGGWVGSETRSVKELCES